MNKNTAHRALQYWSLLLAGCCLCLALTSLASAQSAPEDSAPEDSAPVLGQNCHVVDSFADVHFEPVRAYLLVFGSSPTPLVYPARFTILQHLDHPGSSVERLHVYSVVDNQVMERRDPFALFIFEGNLGTLDASNVFKLSPERIQLASQNALKLSAIRKQLAEKNIETESQIVTLEEDLHLKIKDLEKAKDLEKTISFRNRLRDLQGEYLGGTSDELRLNRLLQKARGTLPSEDDYTSRRNLVLLLRETAEKTSDAVRSSRKQERQLREETERKVRLILKNRGKDAEALLRQLLEVKKQRKELETQLGKKQVEENEF